VRYLLDTHVLLWWRQNDSRLPHSWDAILDRPKEHEILYSIVSIWEISIKRNIGKLELQDATEDFARTLVTKHGFKQIPLELHEICRMETLPNHHRDPFDRLLIAQALETGAIAVTDDRRWQDYPIPVEF